MYKFWPELSNFIYSCSKSKDLSLMEVVGLVDFYIHANLYKYFKKLKFISKFYVKV